MKVSDFTGALAKVTNIVGDAEVIIGDVESGVNRVLQSLEVTVPTNPDTAPTVKLVHAPDQAPAPDPTPVPNQQGV